jgi:hypothetical protein
MLLLIERRPSEPRSEIAEFVSLLAHESLGTRPELLAFDLWESRSFQGREFVRLVCEANTAQQILTQAATGSGIARDVLECDRIDGQPVAWLIHEGQKLQCNPFDVEKICERCRRIAHTNALSDVGPAGGTRRQRMWHLCESCEKEFSVERDRFMHELPLAIHSEMSEEQRQTVAERWRHEINTHMSSWILGDQAS